MPSGVYQRKPEHLAVMRKNLAKGHQPAASQKAAATLKKIAEDPLWRKKVSTATKNAMHRPEVRQKHLDGLEKARKKHGVNFRGGNGQKLISIVELADQLLSQCGYIREYAIRTKPVQSRFKNVPNAYKADFANPKMRIVIELDGPAHRGKAAARLDRKKGRVLRALGWTVLRLNHYNP